MKPTAKQQAKLPTALLKAIEKRPAPKTRPSAKGKK